MTIDWKRVSREPQEFVFTYSWKDVILYALGIGAQTDELSFIYENTPGGLQVFPSFAAKASGKLIIDFSREVEGFRFLHGEQGIRLHWPIPPEGKIMATSRVADVYDKGKAAVIRFLTEGRTEEGDHLFDVEHIAFHVGAGGFGGRPGTQIGIHPSPGWGCARFQHFLPHPGEPGRPLPSQRGPEPPAPGPGVRPARRLRPAHPARPLHLRLRHPGHRPRPVRREGNAF